MFNFQCKFCETDIQSDYSYIGEFVQCPICESSLIVPDPIIPLHSDFHGYTIERMRASTLLWNTYEVSSLDSEGEKALSILRVPGTFFLKRVSNFAEFANVVINSGSMDIPGIPHIKDYSLLTGKVYFIFEYFKSYGLQSFVSKNGAIAPSMALNIVRNVATTLDQVWEKKGKIHQNLLPRNIRINSQLETRIMNIGLSPYLLQDPTLLEQGFNIWDKRYMSPEFAVHGIGDSPLCDIYALGGILYFMVTGRSPYLNVPAQHISNAPIPEMPSSVPVQIASLVQLMMAKQKSIRLQNWKEVIERIDNLNRVSHENSKHEKFTEIYSKAARLTGRYKPVALSHKRRGATTEKIKRKKAAAQKLKMIDTIAKRATPQVNSINSTWQKMKRNNKAKETPCKNNAGLIALLFAAIFITLPVLFFILKGKSVKTSTLNHNIKIEENATIITTTKEIKEPSIPTRRSLKKSNDSYMQNVAEIDKFLHKNPDKLKEAAKRYKELSTQAFQSGRSDIVSIIKQKLEELSKEQ